MKTRQYNNNNRELGISPHLADSSSVAHPTPSRALIMSLEVDKDEYPCRGICSATALGTPFCIGCGRTEYDIVYWNVYNRDKRIELTKQAKQRLQDGNSSSSNRVI